MPYYGAEFEIGDYVSIDDTDVKARVTVIKFHSGAYTELPAVSCTVEWWHEGNLIERQIEQFRLKAWQEKESGSLPFTTAKEDPTDEIPF